MKTKRNQHNETTQEKCNVIEKIFFYHSFPKPSGCKNDKDQNDKGIKIIKSMVKRGFLLPHEDVPWSERLKLNDIRIIRQKRICFTAIEPNKLEYHMKIWGKFSLEFDATNIRMLGGMPIFYIPAVRDNGMDAKFPAQILVKGLFCILDILKFFKSHLGHVIKGLFGLLYPTEHFNSDSLLENFRLSEWRITGNTLEILGTKRWLSDDDKRKLIKSNLLNKEQAVHCLKFHELNGRHVLTYANRIIVPDELVNKVEQILKTGIDRPPKVTAISDFKKDLSSVSKSY